MSGFLHERQGLFGGVDHVGLEAVQRFNTDNDAAQRAISLTAQIFDAPGTFL